MAFGPKSKKRRAFKTRQAVRVAQAAGFSSIGACLKNFQFGRSTHPKIFVTDRYIDGDQAVDAFEVCFQLANTSEHLARA